MDIIGVENDCAQKRKTQVVSNNGLAPLWNETFTFEISMPELASFVITVMNEDAFGDSNVRGQQTPPLCCAKGDSVIWLCVLDRHYARTGATAAVVSQPEPACEYALTKSRYFYNT